MQTPYCLITKDNMVFFASITKLKYFHTKLENSTKVHANCTNCAVQISTCEIYRGVLTTQ